VSEPRHVWQLLDGTLALLPCRPHMLIPKFQWEPLRVVENLRRFAMGIEHEASGWEVYQLPDGQLLLSPGPAVLVDPYGRAERHAMSAQLGLVQGRDLVQSFRDAADAIAKAEGVQS